MQWETQRALFSKMIKQELDLLTKKGAEYASEADALDNFKAQGKDIGVDPKVVLSVLMNKHYRSIQSYIRSGGKTKSNEPIEGRIQDLRNYLFLMLALIEDEKVTSTDTPKV